MSHQSVRVTKERVSEGPAMSTKTTTYETTTKSQYSSGGDGGYSYAPRIGSRQTIIQRTSASRPGQGSSMSMRSSSGYGMGMGAGLPSGSYQVLSQTGITSVKDGRDKEKKDMQDLNERFASYIEKVRFLEAQNRKLADELDKLKQKWGKETTAIKAMYQAELDEARRLLDEAEKEKARLQIRVDSLEQEMDELRQKLAQEESERIKFKEMYDDQCRQLIDMESEIKGLRQRIDSLENDKQRDKAEIARLTDALNRCRLDLDNETLAHIDAENRRQTLEEELEFLKSVHEQEMKELAALAYRDTTQENREFWKNEMGNALREIQQTYDEKLDQMRGELDGYYNMKIQEFRTGSTRQNMETSHAKEETKRLRSQLSDLRAKLADLEGRNAALEKELEFLRRESEEKEREYEAENTELKNEVAKLRAEMEAILKELQDLMDTKLGLELEIAAYRKLLEGEENRVGLRQIVESIIQQQETRMESAANTLYTVKQTEQTSGDSSLRVSQVVKGEMSAKTTYQRSAKGPVSISECDASGLFVTLENTGRKEENLGNWKIVRIIDGRERAVVTLDADFKLRAGGKCKLFADKKPGNAGAYDIQVQLFDPSTNSRASNYGMGANITTKLCNQGGEDRATHVQKTIYSS